ncbi:MAG TPA: serine hydrolase [Candidatus Koribacter sp.]|jgi:CubicO group peptidase (beta-lactamase class C family)
MRRGLLLAFLLTSSAVTIAQAAVHRLDGSTISPDQIDATVTRLMKAGEVPGLSLAVINNGKIVYLKTYGYRDVGKKLPYDTDTIVYAASFTKVAFTYTVLQLVQDKVIDLDKPVYQYLPKPLPEYENWVDLAGDTRWKKITARMLLSHTSGMADWRFFEADKKLHIHFDPGTRYAYSGEGMQLLQFVVETITKQPLLELMKKDVFEPFGMTNTGMKWEPRFETNFASGYDEYSRDLGPERKKHVLAAGSMLTTITDYAHFVAAVSRGDRLTDKMRKEMLAPVIAINYKHQFPELEMEETDANKAIRLSYGLGVGLYWSPYGEAFFKEGHDDGWNNYFVMFEKPKTGIVIMANSSNGESIFKELLETILRDTFTPIEWEGYTPYNERPPRPPLAKHTETKVEPKVLDKYVGKYGNPPKLVLVVRREGDHLSVQENEEEAQDLLAESETSFFSTISTDVFTFEMDKDGKVTQMVLHDGERTVPLSRVP